MTYIFAGQFGPEDFRGQDVGSKLLINPTSAAVYLTGTTTPAALYTDRTKSTSLSNPLPTGVAADHPGIDVTGNITFFADPATYDIKINGTVTYSRPVFKDNSEPLNLSTTDLMDFAGSAAQSGDVPTWNGAEYVPTPQTGSAATLGTQSNPFTNAFWRAADGSFWQVNMDTTGAFVIAAGATQTPQVPDVPVLQAPTAGNTKVTLLWSLANNATSYQPYYNTSNTFSTATAFGSPVTSTSVDVTSLTNTTPYFFWLTAIGSGGTSDPSVSVTATPTSGGGTVPVPAAPVLTAQGGDTVMNLSLTAVTGADHYVTTRLSGSGSSSSADIKDFGADGNGFSNTTSFVMPSDVGTGDFAYWGVAVYNGVTVTTPSGWSLLSGGHNDDATASSAYVFKKVLATSDRGNTQTATASAVGHIASVYAVATGLDAVTEEDVALPSWATNSGSASITSNTATASHAADGVLAFVFQAKQPSDTVTFGSGLTKVTEFASGIYATASVAFGTGGAASSTLGPYSATFANSGTHGQMIFVALRAATTGGTITGTTVHTGPELSFQDTGRTNGTPYSYQSVAVNSAGVSGPASNIATDTPSAPVVVTPPPGVTAFASIQQGVYRDNYLSNGPKSTGQHPGSVADYAVAAGKSASLSQMWALVFCDDGRRYNSTSGNVNPGLAVWAATSRKLVIGGACGPVSPDDFTSIANGSYDQDMINFYTWCAGNAPTCVDRFTHEFDNAWNYANSKAVANPTAFIAAWRRRSGILKAHAPNVVRCWNPTSDAAAAYLGTSRLDLFYPGDAYVDVIGLDCYDSWSSGGATPTSPWTTAQKNSLWTTNTLPKLQNISAYAQAHGKPLYLPEWGLRLWDNSSGGDDDVYVNGMIAFITDTRNNVQFQAFWEDPTAGGMGVFDPDSGRTWKTPLARAAMNTALGSSF